ncbi:MAG: DUF3892 domain-containing protein [Pseudomonadota bacterium]
MPKKIRGNADGPGGRNESYNVRGRGDVSRSKLVKEVDQGKHQGYHTIEVKGRKYVRDNPDSSTKDNVDD